MRAVAGIDPGLSGAVAILDKSQGVPRIEVYAMPVIKLTVGKSQRSRVDLRALQDLIDYAAMLVDAACIEDLSGRPSTVVSFRNGKKERIPQKGLWEQGWNCCAPVQACVAARVPYQMITPAVWKRRLDVPADKAGAKLAADRLYPGYAHLWALAKDDGKAEALLMAHYLLEANRT